MFDLTPDEWIAIRLSIRIAIVATAVALPFGIAEAGMVTQGFDAAPLQKAGNLLHGPAGGRIDNGAAVLLDTQDIAQGAVLRCLPVHGAYLIHQVGPIKA